MAVEILHQIYDERIFSEPSIHVNTFRIKVLVDPPQFRCKLCVSHLQSTVSINNLIFIKQMDYM